MRWHGCQPVVRSPTRLDAPAPPFYRAGMVRPLLAALALALGASACAASPPPPPPRPPVEALRRSLEQAERDFAAASAARGADAWADVFAEDGMIFDADGEITRGKAAIRARLAPILAKVKIAWRPVVADVAPGGEMGFTYGPYEVIAPDEQGRPKVVSRGSFMTVWRRQADGTWKVAADMGSKDTSYKP
jgi:ketosteroid isomerase-like protein